MNELVYHYCSLDSFIKVLSNSKIKFSDIRKSNDKEEIEYIFNQFKRNTQIDQNNNVLLANNFFINQQFEFTDWLVTCFSEAKDTLHMWNAYANGGVAIGFDKDVLKCWSEKITYAKNELIYSYKKQNKYTAKFGEVKYYGKEDIDSIIKEYSNKANNVLELFAIFFEQAPFIKTDFWKEEKEWRIVIPFIYDDLYNAKPEVNSQEHGLKGMCLDYENDKEFGVKSYCLIPFDLSMISEIIIAPNCKVDIDTVKKMLYSRECDIPSITKSKYSLR